MLRGIEWPKNYSYETYKDNDPIEFYIQALFNSKRLDLLLGYFSSSAINILSLGFAVFLYNGGVVRIVINNILSLSDKDAIIKGKTGNIYSGLIDINNIKDTADKLSEYGVHFFECLSWMIANDKIIIKIITPKDGLGISHYKKGLFFDGLDEVGFSGSCNFTASGLIENLESIEIYLRWNDNRSVIFIDNFKNSFEDIFYERNSDVKYINPVDVILAIKSEFGLKDIDELLVDEKYLIEKKRYILRKKKVVNLFDKMKEQIGELMNSPRFPMNGSPRDYQNNAYIKWTENECNGVFAMATGTGKTITALNCVLNEYKKNLNGCYHVLILVPTIILVEQWAKASKEFNFKNTYNISSRINWKRDVMTILSENKYLPTSFVLVCTYDTFVSDSFNSILSLIPEDTLLIADEAHNIGRPSVINKLKEIKFMKKIGLSATPKRIYDLEGTEAIEMYFKDAEPYAFNYSLKKALIDDVLCQYYYYPHIIYLTEKEQREYNELTNKIIKMSLLKSELENVSKYMEILLRQRKRIIHKASNKLPKLIQILTEHYNSKGIRYVFVYVPEGYVTEVKEYGEERILENVRLINKYTQKIAEINDGIIVHKLVGEMNDREEVLAQFEEGLINVLTSMKCLDEGVDIPRAEMAIFCSSTGNPRQFIQRRGRILRKHKDKSYAVIHDLVVVPDYRGGKIESNNYQIEKKQIEKELERVMYFASLSMNPLNTKNVFEDICKYYDLNIYTIKENLEVI